MFVDTAKVELHAGKGGDGAVSFRHEIYIPKGGPDGGDGGRGGSIIFRADKDTNTLLDFRFNPILRAENGRNGAGQRAAGRSGKDLIVEVPIGTMVYRRSSRGDAAEGAPAAALAVVGEASAAAGPRELLADLTADGQTAVIARGGDGGFGNAHFKSSTRQTPRVAEVGEPGEEFEAELELKLLADVGVVGLPNAGKSTFLSVVSNAKPEIADYPFTTLTPNLGVATAPWDAEARSATVDSQDILIADIPGLIEGASEGKGLGHAFLRHVDRTAVLLHLVDVYNDDAGEAYRIIRGELEKYSDLKNRPEIVALTKTEGLDPEIIKMQMASILKVNPSAKVYAISSSAHQGLDDLLRALRAEIEQGKSKMGSSEDILPANSKMYIPDASEASQRMTFLNSSGDSEEPVLDLPVISLSDGTMKDTWSVEKLGDKFIVHGEKIEKFARRTDLTNYASVNRLRDIMKKMGIRGELTSQGAEPDSIISIADKEFTLVEEDWR